MDADTLLAPLFLVKIGLYASALIASGLGLHAALGIVERPGLPRTLVFAAAAAVLALAFSGARLLLINAQLGAGLSDAFNAANFSWTWAAQGPAAIALAGGTLALIICLGFRSRLLLGLGALGVAASFALTGHTQALEPPGIAPWAVALHVLIAGYWFAAPLTLWPRVGLADELLIGRMERFSAWAIAPIPLLFVLGLWLAWRLAGGVEAALSSLYGQLLLAKLLAASIALGIGAFNKQYVTKALQASSSRGRHLLKRTLSLDVLLFAAALALVGWATTMTGPPDM